MPGEHEAMRRLLEVGRRVLEESPEAKRPWLDGGRLLATRLDTAVLALGPTFNRRAIMRDRALATEELWVLPSSTRSYRSTGRM
jgi:hypothetical protein